MNALRSFISDRHSVSGRPPFLVSRRDAGGVLMEYVLVTAVTVGFLVGMSGLIFAPGGSAFTVEGALDGDNFGFLGNAFVDMYRLIIKGISLPIP